MPTKLPPAKSVGEETLALHLRAEHIKFYRGHRFTPRRKWEFDFVILLTDKLAVEVDGGNRLVKKGVAVGRHIMGDDYDKLNEALLMGWRVLRFTPAQVRSGKAIDTIKRALGEQ